MQINTYSMLEVLTKSPVEPIYPVVSPPSLYPDSKDYGSADIFVYVLAHLLHTQIVSQFEVSEDADHVPGTTRHAPFLSSLFYRHRRPCCANAANSEIWCPFSFLPPNRLLICAIATIVRFRFRSTAKDWGTVTVLYSVFGVFLRFPSAASSQFCWQKRWMFEWKGWRNGEGVRRPFVNYYLRLLSPTTFTSKRLTWHFVGDFVIELRIFISFAPLLLGA